MGKEPDVSASDKAEPIGCATEESRENPKSRLGFDIQTFEYSSECDEAQYGECNADEDRIGEVNSEKGDERQKQHSRKRRKRNIELSLENGRIMEIPGNIQTSL
jgi:hypothetical protein